MNQKDPLRERWLSLCAKAQVDGRDQWEVILSSYAESQRAYHNVKHIEDCLRGFDQSAAEVGEPLVMEFAIWFHDLIYDTKEADNEERSAEAAERFLATLPIAPNVGALIRATKHHADPSSKDEGLICDIDLSILGSDPAGYDSYANAIRREYDWVDEQAFETGRVKVLEGFLGRETIYYSPWYRASYEEQARCNLAAEIRRLKKEDASQ